MILFNFAHPLTYEQRQQVEALSGETISEARYYPVQFDSEYPFAEQVMKLVEQVGLSPEQWQGEVILVNPPTLSILAVTLLAELHGRMGYFPAVLRLKPTSGPITKYAVAEIINLQSVREKARQAR